LAPPDECHILQVYTGTLKKDMQLGALARMMLVGVITSFAGDKC
jgi:hypothetical protein